MGRKGRVKLTLIEQQDRKDFILSRLRAGVTRHDVQKQFAKKFNYSIETARTWLNNTCDELTDTDIASRRRTFAVIIEMVHSQITSYQNELLAMQREIDKITDLEDQRRLLVNQLEIASGADLSTINRKLSQLAEPRPTDKALLIEAKFVLLENNLIPGLVAERIEGAIEQFDLIMQTQINTIDNETD